MKPRWLDRGAVYTPRLLLCLSEAEFLQTARQMGNTSPGSWCAKPRGATTHTWVRADGSRACVICLGDELQRMDGITIAAVIAHKAVHVKQELCDWIGEHRPGCEFEAYTVERVAERLMREFVRRTTS